MSAVKQTVRPNRNSPPPEIQNAWSQFVSAELRRLRITRRELASRINIDASNVTLWLRGHVPRRQVVELVGKVLGNLDAARVAAGLMTEAPIPHHALSKVGLSRASLDLIECLRSMRPHEQDAATAQLRVFLQQKFLPNRLKNLS